MSAGLNPAAGVRDNMAAAQTHQQVLRFDVSVDDVDAVQVLQSCGQIGHHDRGVLLRVSGRGRDGVK